MIMEILTNQKYIVVTEGKFHEENLCNSDKCLYKFIYGKNRK